MEKSGKENDSSSDTSSSIEYQPSISPSTIENNTSAQSAMNKPCPCGKEGCSCASEGGSGKMPSPISYIYAIGRVVHRFPNKSLEMELTQAIARSTEEENRGRTGLEVVYRTLTDPANRYLARKICYVLTIERLETYILIPTDPLDVERLAQALRPAPGVGDIDVIIGRRGSIASPEICNGLMVPIVAVDQIYSFDRDALLKAIPKRKGVSEDQFRKTANALFNHIIQIADNAGATDEHRALNYLAVRYDEIYYRTQKMQDENFSFTAVDIRISRLSGVRKILDVIFTYENRANRAAQKWFVRVDVTEQFPFLVSPLQEYFER